MKAPPAAAVTQATARAMNASRFENMAANLLKAGVHRGITQAPYPVPARLDRRKFLERVSLPDQLAPGDCHLSRKLSSAERGQEGQDGGQEGQGRAAGQERQEGSACGPSACYHRRMTRYLSLAGVAVLVPALIGPAAFRARAQAPAPVQALDEEYTKLIKQHLQDPRISTELVDHLPASDRVPTPLKFFGRIVGTPGEDRKSVG